MSNKKKQVHKSGEQIKAEKTAEARLKKAQQDVEKYVNTTYRPDEILPLTGEQFLRIRTLVMGALQSIEKVSAQNVYDGESREVIGYSLPVWFSDVERVLVGFNVLHKHFVDAGHGILESDLRKELEESQNKNKSELIKE